MQNAECRIQKVREECCHEKLGVCNYPDLILVQDSVALCYQIVVIDRERLQRQLGTLSSTYLVALKEALKYTLELDEPDDED